MLSPWFTLATLIVFGVLLFISVMQDIRTRSLTMSLSLALIGISIAGFVSRQEWVALAAYIFLNVISTALYDRAGIQLLGAGVLINAAILTPDPIWPGTLETRMVVMIMGILWAFFFLSKKLWGERGGADFNVIYTTLAVFGLPGYVVFTVIALALGGLLAVYEALLHSRQKTLTGILFSIYLRFTDPGQRSEPVILEIRGKKETIPFIPILYVFDVLALALAGFWMADARLAWLPLGVMIALPVGYFIARRGWERREVRIAPSGTAE